MAYGGGGEGASRVFAAALLFVTLVLLASMLSSPETSLSSGPSEPPAVLDVDINDSNNDDDDGDKSDDGNVDPKPDVMAKPRYKPGVPHRGLLCVLPPKVGGTTISVTIERAAEIWNKTLAKVCVPPLGRRRVLTPRARPAHMGHFTCEPQANAANQFWHKLVHKNPGGLEVLYGPMCYHDFMVHPVSVWRGGEKPVVIGLVRDAWARWVSAWRYMEKRCEEHDPKMPADVSALCTKRLPQGLEHVTEQECTRGLVGDCSEQHRWLAPDHHSPPAHLFGAVYDFVLVLEDFDYSLAVLHFDYSFPLSTLPYVVANSDHKSPMPQVKEHIKRDALDRGLKKDVELHARAREVVAKRVAALNASTKGEFQFVVNRLRHANAVAKANCASSKEQVRAFAYARRILTRAVYLAYISTAAIHSQQL